MLKLEQLYDRRNFRNFDLTARQSGLKRYLPNLCLRLRQNCFRLVICANEIGFRQQKQLTLRKKEQDLEIFAINRQETNVKPCNYFYGNVLSVCK